MQTELGLRVFHCCIIPHSLHCQVPDFATALHYLAWSCSAAHRDVKGTFDPPESRSAVASNSSQPNILAGGSGRARIAEFGHTSVNGDLDPARGIPNQLGYMRWTVPEALNRGSSSTKAPYLW